ncbi:hypothetical protein SRABI128_03867 [Microbacterium sp. Bi128]|nr:hypothetical protein SRABI128_03867 [Microbacterium sp. Bi128]
MGAEGNHGLPGRASLQRLGDALDDVDVLVVPRRHAVQTLGEQRVAPLQDAPALRREEGMPPEHRFARTVFVLLDEEPVTEAFLKQHAAAGTAFEFDGEPASEPVAGSGPENEFGQRRFDLVEDLFRDVVGERDVRRRGAWRCKRHVAGLRQGDQAGVDCHRPAGSHLPERPGVERLILSQRTGELGNFLPREGQFGGAKFTQSLAVPESFELNGRMAASREDQPQ